MRAIVHSEDLTKGTLFFVRLSTFSIRSNTVMVTWAPPLWFETLFKIEWLLFRYKCSHIIKVTGIYANGRPEQWGSSPGGDAGVGGSNRERHTAPGLITLCQAWPTSSECLCYRQPLCKVRMIDYARWVKQLPCNVELYASWMAGLPSWNISGKSNKSTGGNDSWINCSSYSLMFIIRDFDCQRLTSFCFSLSHV